MTCHPERSRVVREAKQPAESKDPLTACGMMDASGSSHRAVSFGENAVQRLC
jgi:hypothetical protein